MLKRILSGVAVLLACSPVFIRAQSPKSATYITAEEVKTVNATPGIDRTIRVVDIGHENFAVGVVHRAAPAAGRGTPTVSTGGGAATVGGGGITAGGGAVTVGRGGVTTGGGAVTVGGGAGRGNAPPAEPCGEAMAAVPAGGTPNMIAHDSQTEGYLIISGAGTLVTGGKIVNGRKSAPNAAVTTELNGPSCSGPAIGDDIVKKPVKTGDIIIIPANVPHGWIDITDHVDYLTFRPSQRVLTPGYVHPSIKK